MLLKKNYYCLVLLIFMMSSALLWSQNNIVLCSCKLLEETEENSKKVKALGEKIEASFHNLETKGFDDNFNKKAFGNLIIKQSKIDTTKSDFARGFISGIVSSSNKLSKKIVSEIENGSYYNFISYEYNIVEKAYYLTFRIYSELTGINYHDYKVCYDNKNVMFNDIYIYITGEHLSETYSRMYFMSYSETEGSAFKTNSKDNDFFVLLKAYQLYNNGNPQDAFEQLNEIKGELATEKFVLIIKSLIASMYDDKLYEETLLEIATLHPDDPTLYLKQIDYYILKENYAKTLELIDKLEFETEDDFLNLFRGSILMIDEKFSEAEEYFYYMTQYYPNLLEGHIGYITSLSNQKKFNESLDAIDYLIEQGYEKNAFIEYLNEKDETGFNPLEKLVTSKEYKKWAKKP